MDICPKTHRSMNFQGNIPTKFSLGIFRRDFRQTSDPRNFLGNLFPRNSVRKFRGISEERKIPRNYFRGLVSSVCRRNNVIPTKFRRFFSSVSLMFSCSGLTITLIQCLSFVWMMTVIISYNS